MKSSIRTASAVLLGFIHFLAVLGVPTTFASEKVTRESNITFTIYGMINEPNLPFDIYADTTSGVWVNSDRVPHASPPSFILDQVTNTVFLGDAGGAPDQIIYLGPDGRWLVKNSTSTGGIREVSRTFKINTIDSVQQLQAYSSAGQVLPKTFKCADPSTGTFPIFSNTLGQPQSCIGEPLSVVVR